jgi:hypothetical protein
MSRIERIQNDLIDSKNDLSSILREAKVLAVEINSEKLKLWTEKELTGYKDIKELPDYRVYKQARNFAQLVNPYVGLYGGVKEIRDYELDMRGKLPDTMIADLETVVFKDELQTLETKKKDALRAGSDFLYFPWDSRLFPMFNKYVSPAGMQAVSVYRKVPISFIDSILSQVRNSLQNYLLEIKIDVKNDKVDPAMATKVEAVNITNTVNVYGNYNSVSSDVDVTQNIYVEYEKVEEFSKVLRDNKVPEAMIDDFKEMAKSTPKNVLKDGFFKWLGRIADVATLISVTPALIEGFKKVFGI